MENNKHKLNRRFGSVIGKHLMKLENHLFHKGESKCIFDLEKIIVIWKEKKNLVIIEKKSHRNWLILLFGSVDRLKKSHCFRAEIGSSTYRNEWVNTYPIAFHKSFSCFNLITHDATRKRKKIRNFDFIRVAALIAHSHYLLR